MLMRTRGRVKERAIPLRVIPSGGVVPVQVVREVSREKTYPDGTEIRRAASWLAELSL